jgi:hypothetical protein
MEPTAAQKEATHKLRTTSINEALGLDAPHKIPGYVGYIPGRSDCVGERYSEDTRKCLAKHEEYMTMSRSIPRSIVTGTTDLPHQDDDPLPITMDSKIPGASFFFILFSWSFSS